jgi:phosphatidylglycerophosphate synthase
VAAVPAYVASMRRAVRPLWFPAPTPPLVPLAEKVLLDTAQAGAADLPARVHAPIETFLVARLCRTTVTPNQLTLLSAASAWVATTLFVTGHLAAGLALALAVGILAGLDGKQARVKLETSKVGELEHVSSFLFELSWWSSLAWLFWRSESHGVAPLLLLALYLTAALDGMAKLRAERSPGRTTDGTGAASRVLRLFGGRRNAYVWILALGHLAGGVTLAYRLLPAWQAATALVRWVWLLPRVGSGVASRSLPARGELGAR